jgi:hypothetical protein
MWKFFYPLRYFRLTNREKKILDIIPTIVVAVLIWLPFYFLEDATFFGANGFLDKILSLAGALTGFYIAALVAAATFVHPDLDQIIDSGVISILEYDSDGNRTKINLTRREFACTVFGYLSFAALAISIGCAVAVGLSTAKFPYFLECYKSNVRLILSFIYCLMISHLFVVTSIGLYYLMDRLYRNNVKVTAKKPNH